MRSGASRSPTTTHGPGRAARRDSLRRLRWDDAVLHMADTRAQATATEGPPRRSGHRADRHRDHRPGHRAGGPVAAHQALPDPQRLDGADARHRPAGARQPPQPSPGLRPQGGRHHHLPPAGRAPTRPRRAAARSRPTTSPARARPPSSPSRPSSSGSSGWAATASRSATGTSCATGSCRASRSSPRAPAARGATCRARSPSRAATCSHGRQPRRVRRRALLGPIPNDWVIGKAFATYWPPKRIGTL